MRRERRFEVHFSCDAFASVAEAILGDGEIEKFKFSIDRGNDGWGFDEENQFHSAYSKGIDCAQYFKSTSNASIFFNVSRYATQVSIESKNERAIESCLAMLDGFASTLEKIVPPYLQREQPKQPTTQAPPESEPKSPEPPESKEKRLRVSSETKFTSCFIRPKTITEVQDFLFEFLLGNAGRIDDCDLSISIDIEGSEGTVQYHDAKDIPAQYFGDGIKSIWLIANRYRGKYTNIDIRLSKKDYLNWVKVSIGGTTAINDETALRAGLLNIITKEKTNHKLFYPSNFVEPLLFMAGPASFVMAVSASLTKMLVVAAVGWSLCLAIAWYYASGKVYKPYTTFATKRNERLADQYRWLVRLAIGLAASAVTSAALKFSLWS